MSYHGLGWHFGLEGLGPSEQQQRHNNSWGSQQGQQQIQYRSQHRGSAPTESSSWNRWWEASSYPSTNLQQFGYEREDGQNTDFAYPSRQCQPAAPSHPHQQPTQPRVKTRPVRTKVKRVSADQEGLAVVWARGDADLPRLPRPNPVSNRPENDFRSVIGIDKRSIVIL